MPKGNITRNANDLCMSVCRDCGRPFHMARWHADRCARAKARLRCDACTKQVNARAREGVEAYPLYLEIRNAEKKSRKRT